MTTYNIHPLALSPTHYLLARAGYALPPVRDVDAPPVQQDFIGVDSTLILSGDPGHVSTGLELRGVDSTLTLTADPGKFDGGIELIGVDSTLTLSGDLGVLDTQYGWRGVDSALTITADTGHITLGLELHGVDSTLSLSADPGHLTTLAPLTYTTENLSLTRRPGALAFDGFTSFDLGPVDFLDLREGLFFRPWRLRVDGNTAYMARANTPNTDWQDEFLLFSYEGSQGGDFGLTFDQNGRPVVCFTQDGNVMLYWYDPVAGSMVIATVGAGRTPKVRLDVRNQMLSAMSDVILMYLTDSKLVFRLQRDRFGTLYETDMTDVGGCYLEETGMATNWRFYAWMTRYQDPGYVADSWHSDIYPYPMQVETDFKVDAIISAATRQALKFAFVQDTAAALLIDAIISAATRDIMHVYEMADVEIDFDVDSVVEGAVRNAIIITEADEYPGGAVSPHINQPVEIDFDVDDIITAGVRLAILAEAMQDGEIEFNVDQILSASIS